MGVLYYLIKIYPFVAIVISFASGDIAVALRRKGNKAWIGFVLFCVIFGLSVVPWAWFRGDKNADIWFQAVADWVHNK